MSIKITEANSILVNTPFGGSNPLVRELKRRKRLSKEYNQLRRFGMVPVFLYDRAQTGFSDNEKLGHYVTFGRAHTFSQDFVVKKDKSRGDIYAEINCKTDSKRIRGELVGISPETFLELVSEMNYLRMFPKKIQVMPEEASFPLKKEGQSRYQSAYIFCTRDLLTLQGLDMVRMSTRSFGNVGNPRVKDKSFFELMDDDRLPRKSYRERAEETLDKQKKAASYTDYYDEWSRLADAGMNDSMPF